MTQAPDRLFQLLPVVYQSRDAARGYPLRGLLRVVAEQVGVVEDNIAQLYQNWFIETCEEWVVPYIGDLLGYEMVHEAGEPGGVGTREQRRLERVLIPRRDVANTIRNRRRKGTLALLERLAGDVAGWPGRAVEFYRLLAVAQHLNHLRLGRGRTLDVRDGGALDLLGGPFDRSAHAVDVRRPNSSRTIGRYDIDSIGLFVWRLKSYSCGSAEATASLPGTPAYCLEEQGSHCYTFSVLGNDTPLYNRPQPEDEPTHIAGELDLPTPIRRRALQGESMTVEGRRYTNASAAYYGADQSLAIWAPDWPTKAADQPVPRERVIPADLTDWRYRPPPGYVAVDPVRGRFVFRPGQTPRQRVRVRYHYAFSADIGGGEYERLIPGPSLSAVSRFHEDDVADWPGLLSAVRAHGDSVSAYLYGHLSALDQASVSSYDGASEPSAPLRSAILSGLNQALEDGDLFTAGGFQSIALPPGVPAALATGPQGAALVRLNRLLLEAAYAGRIARSYALYRVRTEPRDGEFDAINGALAQWRTDKPRHAVIEIADSQVYVEQISIELGANQTLQLQAANAVRPVIRLLDWHAELPDALSLAGQRGSQFTLDGLLITGRPVQVVGPEPGPDAAGVRAQDDLCRFTIRHCTLVPGWGLDCDCEPARPGEPCLILNNTRACVTIESSIVGTIEVVADEVIAEPIEMEISDSIVDATRIDHSALRGGGETVAYVDLRVVRTTVIGQVATHAIRLAENCIFNGVVKVARRQIGCMRFCSVPYGSRTPRRYECQPDLAAAAIARKLRLTAAPDAADETAVASAQAQERARVTPQFNSARYGTPTYCQLAGVCAEEIVRGADDESEMGVFHDLFQPQRDANLLTRLAEYTPAGTDAGVIHAS